LLFIPHISITDYHLSVGGLQWLGPPEWDWLFQFLYHGFNDSWLVVLLLFGVIVFALIQKNRAPKFNRRNLVLPVLWFFGIYILGHVLSLVSTPVLKFPVMLFAFPYFLLMLAILLSRIPKTKFVLIGIMALCLGSSLVEKDLYGNNHYALFKETGIKMAAWNDAYGKSNIYTVYNLNNPDYINFYVDEWGGDSIEFDWRILEYDSHYPLREELLKRQEEYCVVGYSSRHTLVQVYETVKEFYPLVVDYQKCNNGAVFLLKKGDVISAPGQVKKLARFDSYTLIGEWKSETSQISPYSKGDSGYNLDGKNIYGPTYSFIKKDLPDFGRGYLKVEICAEMDSSAQLTVSLAGERNGELIQDRGENMWIGQDLEAMILTSSDNKGYFATTIPYFILPTDTLKIGVWNRGGTPIFISSFRVFYCENKWN
jgi:general stress protein CsbA